MPRRIDKTEDDEGCGEVVLQLADKTVAAPGLTTDRRRCLIRVNRCSRAACDRNAAMTVSGLGRRSVKDKDDEQQTEATLKRGALILKSLDQHAGH